MDLGRLKPRVVGVCLVSCLASEIIHLIAAQGFSTIQSCTTDISSFAGIVCSGDALTGSVMHCMLNEHFQPGLVCTEWSLIPAGRCPHYVEKYSGIYEFPCIGNELCARGSFRSYEVYKYPACLNSSLYITEPTTDITEQPSTCTDCGDGGSTGSTTGTETTTKSTVPTDSKCGIISESSKQSMSLAVPFGITVAVLMTLFCLLMAWEYRTEKSLLGVICGSLKNGYCGHRTTDNEQVRQREAEQRMTSEAEDTDHREEQV